MFQISLPKYISIFHSTSNKYYSPSSKYTGISYAEYFQQLFMNVCLMFSGNSEARLLQGWLLQQQCENANNNAVGHVSSVQFSPVPDSTLIAVCTKSSNDETKASFSANFCNWDRMSGDSSALINYNLLIISTLIQNKYSKIQMADNSAKNNKTNISEFDQEEFGTDIEPGHDHHRTYGNNIVLCKDSNGEPTIVLGPHWYIFMFAFLGTLSLLVLLLYSMQKQLNKIWEIVLAVSTVVYAYSYLRIGLSNPGFAQHNKDLPHGDNRLCQICDVRKKMNIYHCPDCNVCIEGYDHHCPWIGKCVGHKNLSSFYFFLIMIFGTLILCFIATISTAQTSPSSVQHANNDYVVVG